MPGWVLDSEPVGEAAADPKGLSRSLRPRHIFKVDCPCRGAGRQNNASALATACEGSQEGMGGTAAEQRKCIIFFGENGKWCWARGGDLALRLACCREIRADGHGKNANESWWAGAQSQVPPRPSGCLLMPINKHLKPNSQSSSDAGLALRAGERVM